MTGLSGRGIATDWIDIEGDAAELVADHGCRADAIVVARPIDHESEHEHQCVHAALFDSECPVLVGPPDVNGPPGHVVAIAWKDDEPAAMPQVLEQHAIEAKLHTVPDGDGSTGERLLKAAHQVGANLLVTGAFAHGEWRELVFGGVTRTVSAKVDLPLLMRHQNDVLSRGERRKPTFDAVSERLLRGTRSRKTKRWTTRSLSLV
jgi:nucleotide-binding universal stress UspA family protein